MHCMSAKKSVFVRGENFAYEKGLQQNYGKQTETESCYSMA